jgi:hypothetical protein
LENSLSLAQVVKEADLRQSSWSVMERGVCRNIGTASRMFGFRKL